MVVENVRGAQPWVGRARWNFGSFYLWGDVPALMPKALRVRKAQSPTWSRFNQTGEVSPHWRMQGQKALGIPHVRDGAPHTKCLTNPFEHAGQKNTGGSWFNTAHNKESGLGNNPDGRKHEGSGAAWFDTGPAALPSNSARRREAAALIAKIPLALSRHIARVHRPGRIVMEAAE